jgi:hypothetical protein
VAIGPCFEVSSRNAMISHPIIAFAGLVLAFRFESPAPNQRSFERMYVLVYVPKGL